MLLTCSLGPNLSAAVVCAGAALE